VRLGFGLAQVFLVQRAEIDRLQEQLRKAAALHSVPSTRSRSASTMPLSRKMPACCTSARNATSFSSFAVTVTDSSTWCCSALSGCRLVVTCTSTCGCHVRV
jgi:hypothetical protein